MLLHPIVLRLPVCLQRSRAMISCCRQRKMRSDINSRYVRGMCRCPCPTAAANLRLTLSPPTHATHSRLQESRAVIDPAQQRELLEEGSQAADFIRTSVVQAATNERGTYGMPCCCCSAISAAALCCPPSAAWFGAGRDGNRSCMLRVAASAAASDSVLLLPQRSRLAKGTWAAWWRR